VTVNGQTAIGTVSGTTWSATLGTALTDGTYDITATATDPAGNVGTATSTGGLVIDTVPPTTTVSSTASSPTAVSPIPVTVTFNENVTGFTAGDVTVTNGSVSNFVSSDAKTYTFSVTPAATGPVTVSVAAGVAQDAAGNGNAVSNTFSITFNGTLPTVVLTSTATSPTSDNPIPVTATFSEDVTGFSANGVTVTNGTVSNFHAVSGSVYTFDVTPSANGAVTVNIPANVAQDSTGNGNPPATPFTVTFDGTLTTVALTSTATSPTKLTPIPVTATFSGTVTGFAANEITVTNGAISNFVASSGSVYTFDVTPTADGVVTVTIPADVAQDGLGNGNAASTPFSITFDSTAPTVTANPLTTNDTTPTLTGTMNDPTASISVSVDGESFAGTVTGTTWSANLTTELANGTYDITVTATDPAGNIGTATATGGLIIDTVAPTVSITSTATSPTTASPIPVTVTFSENVTGFTASGVTITNGTLSAFTATDAKTYTFSVTPNAAGDVTVSVAANSATDAAGNGNTAATPFTITFNGTLPAVTLSSTASDPTSTSPIPITATFSEDVTGFTASGITVTNGTVSNFAATSASVYTFDVTPDGNGAG